ncbi:MAG: ABC transporter permease [Chloroflexia bacterium]|nr:ABC transporter permease [Chloroflexia bacterium]
MPKVVAQRLSLILFTVLMASVAVFVLMRVSGDPLTGFLPPGSDPASTEALRRELGLDRPLPSQLLNHIGRTLSGDFGDSWRGRQPALDLVLARLPATLLLTATSLAAAIVVGGALGFAAARLERRWPATVLNAVSLTGQAIPAFWLGTLLIIVFAVQLRVLPASGGDGWRSIILPAAALAAYPTSLVARLLSAELVTVRRQPYAATAAAKGLPERTVWMRHLLPNAVLPALAYLGVQTGFLIGGAVVVEQVFAYPGIGRLALQAVADRDIPVVHAFIVVVAILVGVIGSMVDVIAVAIDPRLHDRSARASYGD